MAAGNKLFAVAAGRALPVCRTPSDSFQHRVTRELVDHARWLTHYAKTGERGGFGTAETGGHLTAFRILTAIAQTVHAITGEPSNDDSPLAVNDAFQRVLLAARARAKLELHRPVSVAELRSLGTAIDKGIRDSITRSERGPATIMPGVARQWLRDRGVAGY